MKTERERLLDYIDKNRKMSPKDVAWAMWNSYYHNPGCSRWTWFDIYNSNFDHFIEGRITIDDMDRWMVQMLQKYRLISPMAAEMHRIAFLAGERKLP